MMFTGFKEPTENWSKLPHAFVDELPEVHTLGELKVILYVLRHTWGFQDTEKRISLDEFAYGRKLRDGGRIDRGCGMGKAAIRRGIAQAIGHGYLIVREDASDKARIKRYYQIRMTETNSQGYQNSTPGVSKQYPGGTETIPRTKKETSERNQRKTLSPPASENIASTLDSLGLTRTFEEGELKVGNWRDRDHKHWDWGTNHVHPRDGVSEESLRHTGWLIEHHTGLYPMSGEWKGWCKGLAELYLVTGGDFDAIERAVEHGWDREPKYRPNHPRGFVNAARQKPGEPKKDEGPVRKYRDITDRDVAIAAAKRVNG